MKKSNLVQLTVSTDGKVRSSRSVPTIKGYEEVKKVSYDYDTLSHQTKIEVHSDKMISNVDGLVSSIVNNVPENSGIQLIFTLISRAMRPRSTSIELDSYGRLLRAAR